MISIVTTVKNGDLYLKEAFEGLLAQTYRNFEVCIFNDGSTDRTTQIIDEYSCKFSQAGIKFSHSFGSVSKGVGFGKNAAVQLSSGRFLCFNDADDISLPTRLEAQLHACMEAPDANNCFIGSNFDRIPLNSTERYTQWACNLSNDQLRNQIYTYFGPTIIAPCWFIPRTLYDKVGGFRQDVPTAYPEDLDFFYKALEFNPTLIKVDKTLVLYRWHSNCATLLVSEEIIWELRISKLERDFISKTDEFVVWDVGRRGRKFYRSLSAGSRKKLVQYCDLNGKRLAKKYCEIFDDENKRSLATIKAVHPREVERPVVICEKMEFISDVFGEIVAEKKWVEGRDYILFN